VADRVEIVEDDAMHAIERLPGPFDFIFLDATKTEYPRYLELAEPKASARAVLIVDNLLMSGDVALDDDSEAFWSPENLATARDFNARLVRSDRWLGALLPIGDGVAFAARR
jgi:caffeoyl-CoA O-methyltransferase